MITLSGLVEAREHHNEAGGGDNAHSNGVERGRTATAMALALFSKQLGGSKGRLTLGAIESRAKESAPALLVNLAPVRDPRDRDEHGRIVDDVKHPPVTNPDPPLILVTL